MKLRHAAALALVGWYLMAPPMPVDGQGSARILRNAPLRNWTLVRSFDSARNCEAFKAPMAAEDAQRGSAEMREDLRKGPAALITMIPQ